jgi:hypothetical protein
VLIFCIVTLCFGSHSSRFSRDSPGVPTNSVRDAKCPVFLQNHKISDPRRLDFGGTVSILRAVFRVPPVYMEVHTFVSLFETFALHYQMDASFFPALVSLTFVRITYLDIWYYRIKNNITRMIRCGFVVISRSSSYPTLRYIRQLVLLRDMILPPSSPSPPPAPPEAIEKNVSDFRYENLISLRCVD